MHLCCQTKIICIFFLLQTKNLGFLEPQEGEKPHPSLAIASHVESLLQWQSKPFGVKWSIESLAVLAMVGKLYICNLGISIQQLYTTISIWNGLLQCSLFESKAKLNGEWDNYIVLLKRIINILSIQAPLQGVLILHYAIVRISSLKDWSPFSFLLLTLDCRWTIKIGKSEKIYMNKTRTRQLNIIT